MWATKTASLASLTPDVFGNIRQSFQRKKAE